MTRIATHPGEILREEYLSPYSMSGVDVPVVLGQPEHGDLFADGVHRRVESAA